MATTESARSVDGGKHTHEFVTVPDAGSVTTTSFATSVYGGTPTSIEPDDSGSGGAATTISRSDHKHTIVAAAPGSITPDDAAAEGNAISFARSNHVHGFTCATAAALTKTATAGEGAASTSARSDHVHATDALPWGLVAAPFDATADSSAFSSTTTTDMVLNNVSVIINHWYEIRLHTQVSLSGTGVWTLDLLVNGVAVDRMWRIDQVNPVHTADAGSFWQAPATAATDDFAIRATEASGTATLTLVGAAAVHRWLTIRDLGIP